MADSILRLKVDSQEYDNKLKRAAEGLQRYADGCRKAGGTLEHLDDGVEEFVRELGKMETTSKSAKGALGEMTKVFTDLSVQYNKLTDAEKNSPFGQALKGSLDQLHSRITGSKKELDEINNSINGGGGLTSSLDSLASKFGLNINQLTKFGSVAGVTTTALKVAKDAFFQSESNIDEWGRTVEGAKGAYNTFLDTLNNGNWSSFFQNLQTAIKGGRDLYDALDRLGSIKSNNAAAIAIVQQQIAQLRLAKQQGQNVDDQIKAATERLAKLQGQSIAAGKSAGTQTAFNVIRSGVNSVGGASINDATINYAIQRIMQNGQSEFDKYKYNRDVLRKAGTRTIITPIDDGMGGTVNKYEQRFDINLLTKEQQKQYALAQAITEGETRIQKGIAAYAQAVQEGTASAREEFKGNRYAMQGSGGSSGGGGGGIDINALLRDSWSKASMVGGEKAVEMTGPSQAFQAYVASIKRGSEEASNSLQSLIDAFEALNKAEGESPSKEVARDGKVIKGSYTDAASAVGSLGSALSGLDDPGAKIAGTIAQAIANIALAFSSADLKEGQSGNIWYWIAATAAGMATMISTIASIHSATGYQNGGMIKGNSYSGDNIGGIVDGNQFVGLNAGEVVLTRAMQGNLASQLNAQSSGGGYMPSHISGEQIYIALNRYVRRSGRGEIVTWKS